MPLIKPNQELRCDLKAAASALNDTAQDLFRNAKSCAAPELLIAMAKIAQIHENVDRLRILADGVKVGRITRNYLTSLGQLA